MVKVNPHYTKIDRPYIFGLIDEKRAALAHDDILNLGVGDICHPLDKEVVSSAMQGLAEMGETPHGYSPPEGQLFLRKAIAEHEYGQFGISTDEIFISDGTKSDSAGLQELFATDCRVGITDPTYPTYVDVNLLQGRSITYLPCTKENNFIPVPPDHPLDLIYLCTPNNPTGTCATHADLQRWVDYAKKHSAIILLDAAYVDFARPGMPKSIYEIPGAKQVAIEMRTFSKSNGFTGLRCAYTIVPHETTLNAAWRLRQNNKTNGVSYPIQCAAKTALTLEKKAVHHYSTQARILRDGLKEQGHTVYGGLDAPYIWWKTPLNLTSWEFFDMLLEKAHCVSIPGSAFGPCGDGYVRLSAFLPENIAEEALKRFHNTIPCGIIPACDIV
jgi:LL-diaminopimelate aminotransferase